MSSQTKILVVHRKIFLYAFIAISAILLVTLILYLSLHKTESKQLQTAANFSESSNDQAITETMNSLDTSLSFVPGVYQSDVQLGDCLFEVSICLDADHINSIQLTPIDETVSTMYPLLTPTIDDLTSKIIEAQTIENISYSTEYRYTSLSILKAIQNTLEKASVSETVLP